VPEDVLHYAQQYQQGEQQGHGVRVCVESDATDVKSGCRAGGRDMACVCVWGGGRWHRLMPAGLLNARAGTLTLSAEGTLHRTALPVF
jgi:hypothetical protein